MHTGCDILRPTLSDTVASRYWPSTMRTVMFFLAPLRLAAYPNETGFFPLASALSKYWVMNGRFTSRFVFIGFPCLNFTDTIARPASGPVILAFARAIAGRTYARLSIIRAIVGHESRMVTRIVIIFKIHCFISRK